MLASILFGMPFTNSSEDDRDRVDMLAERLIPEDIRILRRLTELQQTAADGHSYSRRVYQLKCDDTIRFVTDDDIAGGRFHVSDLRALEGVSPPALKTLRSIGCLNIIGQHPVFYGSSEITIEELAVTSLGVLLMDSLRDVQAGLDVVVAEESPTAP